ncbi:MAG: hypothetical protein A2Y03_06120 [Omnitrophica WOR_2 bacterium GWF2_38_59]|nr:MAG: hypothetical protein A2Y03_06120 [Omnitrophica WOR_2 bacterium GWF2_38_59]OGX46802.1 MAG: hypothetical protein A2243_05555 [Omnitrophica WOR_2 bacterium RIFOXYA2_FULL_38_17]OGX52926.1 MAG: hypothetical protein A2267_05775 [Omnitrophica WOR_2 bacterium RIFOXYA12_FULL_38_10]OGX58802.1 MAG: hypothetical protein A2447_06035 [Omnitrophica WOR_2 bacterium RIFOXYC2_FULL_38_12]OGX59643.1 MAG: hypothetical protein A2306_05595 [Omnitrophica WOR_2 bacterium RIFOXYB2_FULL_38_16]HBG61486.1 hypothet
MRKSYVLVVICLAFMGCTTTQQGTTIGGLGGAAVGGIIGHQSGNSAEGAAIGAAAGALGGYVVGEKMKQKFCPVCGRHFDETVIYCPYDGDELKLRVK